jgi:hypothetical protein
LSTSSTLPARETATGGGPQGVSSTSEAVVQRGMGRGGGLPVVLSTSTLPARETATGGGPQGVSSTSEAGVQREMGRGGGLLDVSSTSTPATNHELKTGDGPQVILSTKVADETASLVEGSVPWTFSWVGSLISLTSALFWVLRGTGEE